MRNGDHSAVSRGRAKKPQPETGGAVKGGLPKKPGRKPGKHSNENYTQTSIYLPIELRNRVRARLYERGMEMSGLVEKMLREWLVDESRPRRNPMDRIDVAIKATDESVDVTVDAHGGIAPEHFEYSMPGMLTGADLAEVLAACGIQAEYSYTRK